LKGNAAHYEQGRGIGLGVRMETASGTGPPKKGYGQRALDAFWLRTQLAVQHCPRCFEAEMAPDCKQARLGTGR
jgi:hypothetical protein